MTAAIDYIMKHQLSDRHWPYREVSGEPQICLGQFTLLLVSGYQLYPTQRGQWVLSRVSVRVSSASGGGVSKKQGRGREGG